MKIKNILIFGILFLLILQVGIVLGEEVVDLTPGLVVEEGVDITVSGKCIELNPLLFNRIDFTGKECESVSLKIGENEYNNIEKGGYIQLDNNGEITEAEFTITKRGTYIFGNQIVPASAGSTIIFKDGIASVKIPEGQGLKEFPSLINSDLPGQLVRLFGKNVELPDGRIFEGGVLSFEAGETFVEKGEAAIIDGTKVSSETNNVMIYSRKEEIDSNENYYFNDGKEMALQSQEGGTVLAEILEDHGILDTDDKDKLNFGVRDGDGLVFKSRKEQGLTPSVLHKSSENGRTGFTNNGFVIEADKNGFKEMKDPKELSLWQIQTKKYQSVPFEITSDSERESSKIRINSYNQFVMLNKEDEERVSFNKYDFPVSSKIKDNELQTIDDIRKRYPDIIFESGEDYRESGVPPYLLYLTDNFLKEEGEKAVDVIGFNDLVNSIGGLYPKELGFSEAVAKISGGEQISLPEMVPENFNSIMVIGRGTVDITHPGFKKIRDIHNPLKVISHEHEHVKDFSIKLTEFEEVNKISSEDEEIQKLTSQIKKLGEIKFISTEKSPFKMTDKELLKYEKELSKYFNTQGEISKIEGEIEKIFKKKYPHKIQLHLKYNEIVLNSMGKLKKNKKFFKNSQININKLKERYPQEFNDESLNNLYLSLNKKEIIPEEVLAHLNDVSSFSKVSPKIREFIGETQEELLQKTGIPYAYPFLITTELSSIYIEQPLEIRKERINSQNPAVRKTYTKLTQLAFDSGKMSVEEYTDLLGACKTSDCIERRCIDYQLLCCQQYPSSPNC